MRIRELIWVSLFPAVLQLEGPPCLAGAQERVHELLPMVVEAEALRAEKAGSPVVSVMDPDREIRAGQINDITALLRETEAVFVQDSSYGKQVFLRNLGDQDYRVLIDGMPVGQMGRYYTRSFVWETLPLDNIERIEVIQGPGSAEYGNTLVGTINIVTKRGSGGLGGGARWSLGSFTDLKGGASCSWTHDVLDGYWGSEYRSRDPYLDNNEVEQWSLFSRVGADLKRWGDLSVYAFTSDRNEGFVLDDRVNWNVWSNAQGLAPGSDFDLDNRGVQVSWKTGWVDAAFSYSVYGRDDNYLREKWNPGDWQDYTLWYKAPAAKLKAHHTWGNHHWKAGFEYTYGDAASKWVYYRQGTEDVSFLQNLCGAFAEDSWQVIPRFRVTLGLRFDWFENRIFSLGASGGQESRDQATGDGWSPRVSATYDFTDGIQVYGFFGKVFKAPAMADFYRWYGNYNLISPTGLAVLRAFYGIDQPPMAPANLIPPEYVSAWQSTLGRLKPARGYDAELGLRHSGDRFYYGINLFYEYIDDYIVIYPTSYPPTYNIDNVQLWGLELSGIYNVCRWLEVEGNYAFIQNKKQGDEIVETLYGRDELFNAPEHILNVFLRARPFEGFEAEWQVNFVSSRFAGGAPGSPPQAAQQNPKFDPITELGAYDLHNVHLSYSPGTWKFITPRLSFAVQNLFDRRDFIRLDYPLPGRLFYGGIEVDF